MFDGPNNFHHFFLSELRHKLLSALFWAHFGSNRLLDSSKKQKKRKNFKIQTKSAAKCKKLLANRKPEIRTCDRMKYNGFIHLKLRNKSRFMKQTALIVVSVLHTPGLGQIAKRLGVYWIKQSLHKMYVPSWKNVSCLS